MAETERFLPTHTVAAAGVIENDRGEVLLIRNNRRGWEFPGGMVEPGETLPEGLKREVFEETGVEIEMGEVFCICSNTGTRPGYNGVKTIPTAVVLMFLCRYVSGEPRPSDENAATEWVKKGDLAARIDSAVHREVLAAYLAYDGRPTYLAYKTRPEFVLENKRKI